MARKRRKFTLEFKQEAVRLVNEEGMTYVEVARRPFPRFSTPSGPILLIEP